MTPTLAARPALDQLDAIVDLDAYPIHRLDSGVRSDLVAETRAQMDAYGCCRISSFVPPEAIATMLVEATALHSQAHWATQSHNPYASPPDPTLDARHPRNVMQDRRNPHGVTRIVGATTRYIALPTYVHDPWRMNRPHHSINYYGRATERHDARESALADGLAD